MPLPDVETLQPREIVELIYEQGRVLVAVEEEIEKAKAWHAKLRKQRHKLAHIVLPPLFEKLRAERMSIPGTKAEVVFDTKVTAHIPIDWDDDVRDAGFAELARLGGEDLVRVKISVSFKAGEYELAAELLRHISTWNKMSGREVRVEKSAHVHSLTKFVQELYRRRVPMNLAVLGGHKKRECQVEWIQP